MSQVPKLLYHTLVLCIGLKIFLFKIKIIKIEKTSLCLSFVFCYFFDLSKLDAPNVKVVSLQVLC